MEMASSIIPEATRQPPPTTSRPQPQNNLHNPLPLSASQEAEVRNLFHKRVRTKCADVIKDFADCARGRTISVAWTCREQHLAMNSCMIQYATKAEEDAAREEWFQGILARRKQREEELAAVEKRRMEVIEMTRRQEEKERLEAERKKKELEESKKEKDGDKKKGAFWWR
ncbi:uncharacterized protein PV07_01306 [Cladophialophora immunda]|uniref:COX assembly mitochondrial protein n=1 Tax=Cladophialophora immunda TaxID=569365 RepID=A0A0D2CXG6_9EURO|nr:uncharacterized protein PV07_01306 [Cladophialophora immunda]KIW34530.1 hypothetical protein PV07_01306 [Cladophialophora immunda]OQV05595.1 hypothetical protein CLAIMM_10313 [Cladophialophora immunda]